MESLFNIAWAVLGALGIAGGLALRRHLMPWKNSELVRDVVLLGAMTFVLFPVISMSDDVGYFNYYFSRGQAPDSLFWVSGSRREKQFYSIIVVQASTYFLVATVGLLCRRMAFGTVALTPLVPVAGRSATTAYLRAPPLSLS